MSEENYSYNPNNSEQGQNQAQPQNPEQGQYQYQEPNAASYQNPGETQNQGQNQYSYQNPGQNQYQYQNQYTQAPTGQNYTYNYNSDAEEYKAMPPTYGSGKKQSQGLGIASMVCGILSIVTCCAWGLAILLGIVAVILGIVQLVTCEPKGMAIAGIICGSIGLLFVLFILIFSYAFADSYYWQRLYWEFLDEFS